MDVDQNQLNRVDAKLNKQNAIYAGLGTAFWLMPILVLWFFAYAYNGKLGVMMLLVSGCLIGLAARIHGKGMKTLFSMIAFLAYSWLALLAYSMQIVLHGPIWAVFLFGLYAVGAGLAIYLAKINVPFEEHRAHTKLTSLANHPSDKRKRNRWFIALPIFLAAIAGTSFIGVSTLVVLNDYQLMTHENEKATLARQREINKEIDVTPKGLEQRSTKDILRYAYAYHAELLFDKNGRYSEPFPHSEYKAKTLLKYLVSHRDNARAKFILGMLNQDFALLKEAEEQKDSYALIYASVHFGCYNNAEQAKTLLRGQQRITNKPYVEQSIRALLYRDFPEICGDLQAKAFSSGFALNYAQ